MLRTCSLICLGFSLMSLATGRAAEDDRVKSVESLNPVGPVTPIEPVNPLGKSPKSTATPQTAAPKSKYKFDTAQPETIDVQINRSKASPPASSEKDSSDGGLSGGHAKGAASGSGSDNTADAIRTMGTGTELKGLNPDEPKPAQTAAPEEATDRIVKDDTPNFKLPKKNLPAPAPASNSGDGSGASC